MFSVGEYIVYSTLGICRVESIGPSPYDKSDPRMFYMLIPLCNPSSTSIYTPADNPRVPMRALMTKEEIQGLIDAVPTIEPLVLATEKNRRDVYRSVIESLEPTGYVQVIKTIAHRRALLVSTRKHLPITDLECERFAEHMLYSECAYVLGLPEADVVALFNLKKSAE